MDNLNPDDPHSSPLEYAHLIAIQTWLYDYQSMHDSSRVEQVRGLLESIHHCCEIKRYKLAYQIAMMHIASTRTPLHVVLGHWGYYQQQIELYESLNSRINNEFDLECLYGLGQGHLRLAHFSQARAYFEHLRDRALANGNSSAEVLAWGGLTNIAMAKLQYRQVTLLAYRWLQLAQVASDKKQRICALERLGLACVYSGQGKRGLRYLTEGLALAREHLKVAKTSTIVGSIQIGTSHL